MKKTLVRKLELHRETLRSLTAANLEIAIGGLRYRTAAYSNCSACTFEPVAEPSPAGE